jgi:hypothetical protein
MLLRLKSIGMLLTKDITYGSNSLLRQGKERADITEEFMFNDLQHRGFIID